MDTNKIISQVDYPASLIPNNALQIVEAMLSAKNLGDNFADKLDADLGCSIGFFNAVKKVIADERKAANNVGKFSATDARINRILYITNSDGKRTARRSS